MTPKPGSGALPRLVIKVRSQSQEKLLEEILLHFAGTLSPFVEATAPGIATVEFTDHRDLGGKCRTSSARLADSEINAQAGIAPTADASFLAAHLAEPVLQIENATEFLSALPIESAGDRFGGTRCRASVTSSRTAGIWGRAEARPSVTRRRSRIFFAKCFRTRSASSFLTGFLLSDRRLLQSARCKLPDRRRAAQHP